MKLSGMFPGKYFRASDVLDGPIFVTIANVAMEKVGDDPKPKPVVTFSETAQKLVLNKTNGDRLAELIGSAESADWHGEEIALVHGKASFGSRTVDAVRVENPEVVKRRASEVAPLNDKIPL
jgi:hypothetical protein